MEGEEDVGETLSVGRRLTTLLLSAMLTWRPATKSVMVGSREKSCCLICLGRTALRVWPSYPFCSALEVKQVRWLNRHRSTNKMITEGYNDGLAVDTELCTISLQELWSRAKGESTLPRF